MTKLAIRPKPHTKNEREFQDYVDHLDRATANQGMQALADKYGFPVTEIDGKLYTSTGWVQLLFDYSSKKAFKELLTYHDIRPHSLTYFAGKKNSLRKIREDLNLSPKDNESLLFDFGDLIKAARLSSKPAAREIIDYVFAQEAWARREQAAQRQTGMSLAQLRAQHRQVQGCPVRFAPVEGFALPVFTLPTRGDVVCVSAFQRAVAKTAWTVRGWRRHDDALWSDYDTVSGRELAAMKATGWVPKCASHVAVISLDACDRLADKAGRFGRALVDGIQRLRSGWSPAALPGGR